MSAAPPFRFEPTDDGFLLEHAGGLDRVMVSAIDGCVHLLVPWTLWRSLDGMTPDAADHLSGVLAKAAQYAREQAESAQSAREAAEHAHEWHAPVQPRVPRFPDPAPEPHADELVTAVSAMEGKRV